MSQFEYAVLLTADRERGYVVTCRDLPELTTQGEDIDDVLLQAADAMDEAFAYRMNEGLDFPAPTKARRREYPISPPAETVAKAALHVALREAKVSNLELARRLGVDEKEVRRLLDPHHGSKLPRIAQAIEVLGRRLRIELSP